MFQSRDIFITGATGFMGSRLAAELLQRGHRVRALARPGSESKVPKGCEMVHGDALRAETYSARVAGADTFVHLIGVAHPNPRKVAEFRSIDLRSCQEAVRAAAEANVRQLHISQRGPACAGDAGISGGARRGRTPHPREGNGGDIRPSVVCAWSRTQMAAASGSAVCAGAIRSSDARRRQRLGTGDGGANDASVGLGGGESVGGHSHYGATSNSPRIWRVGDEQTTNRIGVTQTMSSARVTSSGWSISGPTRSMKRTVWGNCACRSKAASSVQRE